MNLSDAQVKKKFAFVHAHLVVQLDYSFSLRRHLGERYPQIPALVLNSYLLYF